MYCQLDDMLQGEAKKHTAAIWQACPVPPLIAATAVDIS
jgi:hypothetical protein